MTVLSARYAPPGPEFMDRVSVAAWVEPGLLGPECHVLLTPARPRLAESVERYRPGLLGIARGLGLGRPGEPYRLGLGLLLVRGIASLDYGHWDATLNVPYPPTWYATAQRQGRVNVAVGLSRRELGGGLVAVHEYLADMAEAGGLWTGVTAWRRTIPAAWLLRAV
ncbi:hypothetical protein [Streptomyces marianii]|uniref:Uncharacterized protein n=1 Tax=Streptomyces marianii TaxID=1817406 RepID=A0A5R9DS53_9ACTN|nr:hypothetical protein [Streptomyces marianii]TLQ39447.1 hypothetical protein FEF34_39435 [Streptomyces marianii]